MSWSQRFAEPIVLPDGGKLRTLREAVAHLGKAIPKSDHDMPSVTTAADLLTLAAEHGGPIEFARIATLQALNRIKSGNSIQIGRSRIGAAASWHGTNDGVGLRRRYEQGRWRRGSPQVFADADAARKWFEDHDPEGVAFEYVVERLARYTQGGG